MNLSVVLSTLNEEENIGACIDSIKDIADEVIVFDEFSDDKTREIAKKKGAKVYKYRHTRNFHQTKQKAIDKATGDWILQLDADERVSLQLAKEIKEVMEMEDHEILARRPQDSKRWTLFKRHEELIREREGGLGKANGEVVAFFVPRLNFFVSKPLIHAGVYPDAVIRLIKQGKARLPAKTVHELMEVDGEVSWLFNALEHHESPTLHRYLAKVNRYTSLTARELAKRKVPKTKKKFIYFSIIKPNILFLKLFIRHKGYKDGMRGFLWSAFSAFHWPLAYWKYWVGEGG